MCTAINWNGYFGRTLDYEVSFGERVVSLPRGYTLELRHRKAVEGSFAIVGMARLERDFPLFFDGMNERGVAMAGLNFVGNAYFPRGEAGDVSAFELIPYILSQAESVSDAKELLQGVRIADTPFSPEFPTAPLHWLIGDKSESVTVESGRDGVRIYENPAGVLTNNPPFPYQMMHLNCYLNLTAGYVENRFSKGLELKQISRGMGAIGLPGDWSSPSRFVRATFVRENALKERSVAHFFNIMSSVSVPKGCMALDNGEPEYTRYIACMDLENGVYYHKTYDGMSIEKRGF